MPKLLAPAFGLATLIIASNLENGNGQLSEFMGNGSTVYLVADGAKREFHYDQPRPGMLEAGAQPGSLLFTGRSMNGRYFGTAYIFSSECGQIPYKVSGPILDNYERVVLTEQAPRVDANCHVVGYFTDTLESSYLKSVKTAPDVGGSYAYVPPLSGNVGQLGTGTDLTVINVAANDVLKIREYPTDSSRVIDTISSNATGVVYLGETKGQWVFVRYERAEEHNRANLPLRPETQSLIDKFTSTLSSPLSRTRLVEADVPAIGCPQDGQVGPQDAPMLPNSVRLAVPDGSASSLVYYSAYEGVGSGVLAPKGWNCFGTYGSAGATLYVIPHKLSDPILDRARNMTGPVVLKSAFTAETSGRFPVATISARIFPLARAFVDSVRSEENADPKDFVFTPWPSDRLNYLSGLAVSYVTPPGVDGLGTAFGPAPGKEPISGLVFLNITNGPSLERLAVRLAGSDQHLYAAIAVSNIAMRDTVEPIPLFDGAPASNPSELTEKISALCQEQWRIPETIALCVLEAEYGYGTQLAAFYHKALVSGRNSEGLRRSQRSWLKYQEANCRLRESSKVTSAYARERVSAARCLLRTTLQRLEELQQITERQ
jgi:uncharacterized protein YecT (DUF1311 family)